MKKFNIFGAMLVFAVGLCSMGVAQAAVITLQSGNGVVGGLDSQVRMLVGPANTGFTTALTPVDFAAASAGVAAYIVTPHVFWAGGLTGNPAAQWISTNSTGAVAANSALYAITFNIAGSVSNAILNFSFFVDNQLGDALNQGLFINGVAISGTSGLGGINNGVSTAASPGFAITSNITSLLVSGLNTLYINAANLGGPAGLLFSANITTTPVTAVSISGTVGLLLFGLLILSIFSARNREFFKI